MNVLQRCPPFCRSVLLYGEKRSLILKPRNSIQRFIAKLNGAEDKIASAGFHALHSTKFYLQNWRQF